ncbi:hypothetical protein HN51_009107 [Arachis hypogaea]
MELPPSSQSPLPPGRLSELMVSISSKLSLASSHQSSVVAVPCWSLLLSIGFAVFLVHLATIPITRTGINPVRSHGATIIFNRNHAWNDQ